MQSNWGLDITYLSADHPQAVSAVSPIFAKADTPGQVIGAKPSYSESNRINYSGRYTRECRLHEVCGLSVLQHTERCKRQSKLRKDLTI